MKNSVWCVGIATQDHIFALHPLPDRGAKYRATAFQAAGGGVAATAAVAIALLGGDVSLLTRLGRDDVGDAIVTELSRFGVNCGMVQRFVGATSSLSAIIIDKAGERMIINFQDPGMPDSLDWLPKTLSEDVAVVLADTRWPEGSRVMLERAKAQGRIALLDGDVPACPTDLLAAATLVAFSADGLREATGVDDMEAALRQAATMGDGLMMVTDGANGVFWLEGGSLQHFPAYAVKVVDTLGAGDVFHGALALRLAQGVPLRGAVQYAAAAAAIKVTRFGGRTGAPNRTEVDEFLARHN